MSGDNTPLDFSHDYLSRKIWILFTLPHSLTSYQGHSEDWLQVKSPALPRPSAPAGILGSWHLTPPPGICCYDCDCETLQVHRVALWIKEIDHGYLLRNAENAESIHSILKQKVWVKRSSREPRSARNIIFSLKHRWVKKKNMYKNDDKLFINTKMFMEIKWFKWGENSSMCSLLSQSSSGNKTWNKKASDIMECSSSTCQSYQSKFRADILQAHVSVAAAHRTNSLPNSYDTLKLNQKNNQLPQPSRWPQHSMTAFNGK